jgi:hypothetical protein
MTGLDEPPTRLPAARGTGQLLLYASLGLVAAAAATLALGADDVRLLGLGGGLAALGAVLLGAFAVAKMRRQPPAAPDRSEDPRTIYRLELERDIAARREHELDMERELRREAKDSRDELEAVRAELRSLRETLQQLLSGELLVERVAVRAESTRVRSLPEEEPPSRLPALDSAAADLMVPQAGKDEPEHGQRSVPPPDRSAAGSFAPAQEQRPDRPAPPDRPVSPDRPVLPESSPLPRRDPEVRAAPIRRPRPEEEASRSAPHSASFAENPLFAESPLFTETAQRSNASWTLSRPSAPRSEDPRPSTDPQPPPQRSAPAGNDWVPPGPRRPATRPAENVGARSEADPPTVPMPVSRRHDSRPDSRPDSQPDRGLADEPTGAHSGGRSVDDLLAAYGGDAGTRRRRRREDD